MINFILMTIKRLLKRTGKSEIKISTNHNDTTKMNSSIRSFNKVDCPIYFIIGCARSGTTSLAKILDTASNGICLSEPEPNLGYESRNMLDGIYIPTYQLLLDTVLRRAASALDTGMIYGEKNVTLGPFISYIEKIANAKFVYIKRDGRDSVRSMINWHNQIFGNIYRECNEEGELSLRAKKVICDLHINDDMSDYARPRPKPDDIWYEKWPELSRLEMCAWYWSRINELILNELEAIEKDKWISIDYTSPNRQEVLEVANYLQLEALDSDDIQSMLDERINSVEDRVGERSLFPAWNEWSSQDRARFECIACNTMLRLGYYPAGYIRYKPDNYGDWWRQHTGGTEWYEWMYYSRISAHEDLIKLSDELVESGNEIQSILDVGCGRAIGYSESFKNKRYVGYDLSKKEIEWCNVNNKNDKHEYICGDIILEKPEELFDLVFSQGTIDNSYDINAYIRRMVEASKGWIYIASYRGWFPDLDAHHYTWDESTTCFYNNISPNECRTILMQLGCTDITIEPLPMIGSEVDYETRIVARAPVRL